MLQLMLISRHLCIFWRSGASFIVVLLAPPGSRDVLDVVRGGAPGAPIGRPPEALLWLRRTLIWQSAKNYAMGEFGETQGILMS